MEQLYSACQTQNRTDSFSKTIMEPIHPKYTRICCKIFDLVELQIKYLYRERKKESPPPRLLQTQKRKNRRTYFFLKSHSLPFSFNTVRKPCSLPFRAESQYRKAPKCRPSKQGKTIYTLYVILRVSQKKDSANHQTTRWVGWFSTEYASSCTA